MLDSLPCAEITLVRPLDSKLFIDGAQASDLTRDSPQHPGWRSRRVPGFAPVAAKNYQCGEGRHGLVIETKEGGFNSGRTFVFRCKDEEESTMWRGHLERQDEIIRQGYRGRLDRMHRFFECIASSLAMKGFSTSLVLASFVSAVVSAQMKFEKSSSAYKIFLSLDNTFTMLFLVEILINLLAFGRKFFLSAWMNFDGCIVLASVVQLFTMGRSNSELRVLRSLQVLRSFEFSRLKVIAMALIASIVPVLQAAFLALIVMSLYCLIGVQLFGESAKSEFGTFTEGFYTLFQVMLGRWPDDVPALRPFHDNGNLNFPAIMYIYSYYLLVVIVLINLVIAVLLVFFSPLPWNDFA